MTNPDDIRQNVKRYLKSVAMDLVVIIVAISYVFYQMVTLEKTDANPLVLLAQAFMGIVCGIVIKQALGENGFSRGYNSDLWADESDKYDKACNTALPHVEKVDNFYQYEILEKKKNYRIQHLQEVRLKYTSWFDKDGNYIGTDEEFKKLKLRQKYIVKKCIKVRIYPLNLFSQYTISTEQDTKKEITDRRQRVNNATKNTVSATAIAIIGVYFIPGLTGWSWASFVSATMQVSMWVLFGILQLYTNYNFVVQDKVALLKKKKELIKKFTTGCEAGMYKKSPYDEATEDTTPTTTAVALIPQSN